MNLQLSLRVCVSINVHEQALCNQVCCLFVFSLFVKDPCATLFTSLCRAVLFPVYRYSVYKKNYVIFWVPAGSRILLKLVLGGM